MTLFIGSLVGALQLADELLLYLKQVRLGEITTVKDYLKVWDGLF